MSLTPLLDGPDLREGAEPAAHHLARLGPSLLSGPELIDALDQSDLRGRGGAGFPVGRKWRSVAGRQGPRALIANGAEGEPLSFKDRLLMQARPHLVLDGRRRGRADRSLHRARTLRGGRCDAPCPC